MFFENVVLPKSIRFSLFRLQGEQSKDQKLTLYRNVQNNETRVFKHRFGTHRGMRLVHLDHQPLLFNDARGPVVSCAAVLLVAFKSAHGRCASRAHA